MLDVSAKPLKWLAAPFLAAPRGDLCAATTDARAFVFGGFTDANGWCPALSSVESFDAVAGGNFSTLSSHKQCGDPACAAADGKVYVSGASARPRARARRPPTLSTTPRSTTSRPAR